MPRAKAPLRKITAELFRPKVLLTADIVPILQRRIEEDEARRHQIEEEEKALREAHDRDMNQPRPNRPSRVKTNPFWLRPIKSIGRGMTKIDGVILTKKQIEQFWSEVRKTDDPDECWVWKGECTPAGHGTFRAKYKTRYPAEPRPAHRIAYMLENDQVEFGVHILHKCGLAPCCNPRHLYEGDRDQNYKDVLLHRDMLKKLTDQDREDIKASSLGMVKLAAKYEVTTGIIWAVKFGKPGARKGRWWEWY